MTTNSNGAEHLERTEPMSPSSENESPQDQRSGEQSERSGQQNSSEQPAASGGESKPAAEAWTVLKLLEWTTDFFRKRGSASPRLDAEVLLAHVRDCSRVELYTAFSEEPDEEQRVAFREMVRRRGEGMPVAQLVGYREFYSLRFRVNEHTLIPRPETEHLIVEALDCASAIEHDGRPLELADIGTGSGAIAVTLAKHLPDAHVIAVDCSSHALKIAAWNADKLGVDGQIRFIESDLLDSVAEPEQFDIICSNPPYISDAEYEQLDATVREFEPRNALVCGPTGTEVIERILKQAPERLRPGGRLILELSPMIADACEELAKAGQAFDDLRFIKDLAGHRRILSLRRI